MATQKNLKVTVVNGLGRRLVLAPVRDAVTVALVRNGIASGRVNVRIASDAELRALNREFRDQDSATDVLTFPAPESFPGEIGDVIVSIDFARKGAEAREVRLADETAMLAVHGALHLAGFDDETDADRAKMLKEMNAVMRQCGLPEDHDWSSLPHGGAG